MRKLDSIYVTVNVKEPSVWVPSTLPTWIKTKEEFIENEFYKAADQAEKDIQRHLDVEIGDRIHNYSCGYCHAKWTEESLVYNGGCCEADESNNPNPEI